jgi:Hemerythrin HHE cation binding domain
MLERLLLPEKHAISILIKDHDTVKELFDRFEKSKSAAEKEKIIADALTELKIHAVIEEEIFYPAVRKIVGKDLMNEADEEHHVARVLIAELDRDGRGNDHRDAKFTVLAESVRHHIKEEEGEMLPKAKSIEMNFEALGQQMLERKKQLKRDGIPSDAEHAMVAGAKGSGDTPAAAARRRKSPRGAVRPVQARRKPRPAKASPPSKRSRMGSKIGRKQK